MASEPKKILIIEDDEGFIAPFRLILERDGFTVVIKQDGQSGFVAAKEELPDLILLDLMLPAMSGFDVLEKLKKDEQTKNIKIVIISNLSGEAETNKALSMGAKSFLVKTRYSLKDVVAKIRELVTGDGKTESL